ncbi:MAG: hypothetical protein ACD_79C00896G0002 [uncultured bacterium]|nr:MAG: hypothetical protein ACD_79C00896G0002 [uncultured bacterium]
MPNKKILIVDDEISLRESLGLVLEGSGYDLFFAENGNTALEMCKKVKPDLILLDIYLPDRFGMEIVKIIRSVESLYGDPKIIIITGIANSLEDSKIKSSDAEDTARALWKKQYDVADFFTKPFNFEVLINRINEILSK